MFEVFDDVRIGKYERNTVTKTEEVTSKSALETVMGPLEIKGIQTQHPKIIYQIVCISLIIH